MPYSKTSELPDAVKALPSHAQTVWQSAFNAAFKEYGDDEAKCAATAWAAVKSAGYEKDDDSGEWERSKEAAITAAIAKLRPVDPSQFTVYRVSESAVLLKDGKEQLGILPYVEKSGGYAFGQFRYPPVPMDDPAMVAAMKVAESAGIERTAEMFTAKESEEVRFTAAEGVDIDGTVYHANAEAGEHPVFIVAEGINKAKMRQYSAKALEAVAPGFYDGMPMHLDHAGKEGELNVRSVKEICGKVLKSGRAIVHEGVRKIPALVKFTDAWTREHMADPDWRSMVGLSHVADVAGYVGKVAGKSMRVIESIVKPYAVDVVSTAAFGGKVMESAGVDRRLEDLDMLETLKIEDLTTHRPDLVTAIKESAVVEFRAQEGEDDAVKAATARAEKAEADARTARLETQTFKVREAAGAAVAVAELKVPDAAKLLIVDRVAARLGTAELSADKLSATVQAAVVEEVKLGAAFAPAKPPPTLPPNRADATQAEKRASLQEKFDNSFGVARKADAKS